MMACKDPRLRSLSNNGLLPSLPVESPPAAKQAPSMTSAPPVFAPSSASTTPTAPSPAIFAATTTPTIPVAPVSASSSHSRTPSTHSRTTPAVAIRHPLPPNPLRMGNANAASRSSSVLSSSSPTLVNAGGSSESSIDSIRRAVWQSRQPEKLSSLPLSSSNSHAPLETKRSHPSTSSSSSSSAAPSCPSSARTTLSVQPPVSQRPRLDRKESDPKPPSSSSSSSSSSRSLLERQDKDKGRSSSNGSNGGSKPLQESSKAPSTSYPTPAREPGPMPSTRYRNPFEKSKQATADQPSRAAVATGATTATATATATTTTAAARLPYQQQGGQRPSPSSSPRAHQWPSPTHESLHPRSSPPKSAVPPSKQTSSTPRADPTSTLHSPQSETSSPRTGSSSRRIPDARMDSPTIGWSRSRPSSPNREPRARGPSRVPDPKPAPPRSDPSARTPSRGPDSRTTTLYREPPARAQSRDRTPRSTGRAPSRDRDPRPAVRAQSRDRDPRPAVRAPSRDRDSRPTVRAPSRERDFRSTARDRDRDFGPAAEQERGRSVTRGRSVVRAPSAGRDWTRYDSYRPAERGQSRSGCQSRAGSPTRNQSRAKSPARGRSKSRARHTSLARSRSRPVRRTMTMGNFVPRSPSRKRRHYITDDSDFDNDSDSFTDHSTRKRRQSSSAKRRHSPEDSDSALETSEESDESALASDAPLLKRRRLTSTAPSHMDASARLQGPIADRMLELDRLTTKLTARQTKVEITYRKMMRAQAKLKAEILALQSSFSSPNKTSKTDSLTPGHNIVSVSRALNGSSTDSDNAVVPTPMNRPTGRIETGLKASHADVPGRNISSTKGYRRVFDVAGPSSPVSSQADMSALVIGDIKLFNNAFGGLRPRIMVSAS